ncbi:MAG TPA: DinB family protein [Jatrophihabitans sp.]|nr:DinB family protein [Jatrophihabitans sp.]
MDVDLHHLVFGGFDYVWERLRKRVEGLTTTEYLWEPVPDMWSVHDVDGRWVADSARPDPVPAPVTTIAWRLWHIADCLASYVAPHLGEWPLPGEFRDWFGEVGPALVHLDVAHDAFRERVTALGEDGLRRELGPDWGPYEHESWAALVLHAMDEVAHHGAEVALLRDLYARLG